MTDINPPATGPSSSAEPRPWTACDRHRLAQVRGVFTDIDDTLTREGAIEPAALLALERLNQAGIPVIAVTGRPAGWSRPFALAWPVAAIVAENGAVALRRDGSGGLLEQFVQDAAVRATNHARLQAVARRILAEVPGAALARDSAGRLTDIAIDHSEFTTLPEPAVAQVVALMREAGMNATVSSIHINGWFGTHTKWSGACWMARELFGTDLAAEVDRWVYVGDSTNDQAMFERFALSVGVANLWRFRGQLTVWPRYVTQRERGEGFAEVGQRLLAAIGPSRDANGGARP